jgi:hypothetical protein
MELPTNMCIPKDFNRIPNFKGYFSLHHYASQFIYALDNSRFRISLSLRVASSAIQSINNIWSVAKAVLSWKTNPARVDLTSSALTSLP